MCNAAQSRIQKNLGNAVAAYLKSCYGVSPAEGLPNLQNAYKPEIDSTLTKNIESLLAVAMLLGMEHATGGLKLSDEEIPALPFEEAVSFMKGRIPMTKQEWNALEPKLRFRAFTVGRLAQCDYIEAVRGRLINAMRDGQGFSSTWNDIKAVADADGAFQWSPGYWENIFRTNTQTAYVAGKLMQHEKNPPPAWRLMVIDDSRTSDICRGLVKDGSSSLVLASNHPFWSKYGFPPYHFQCRTGLQAVYSSQIGTDMQVENPSMESLRINFKPQKGFGGNPVEKESWWMITENMAKRALKYGIGDDVVKTAANLGIENLNIEMLKGYEVLYVSKTGGYVMKAKLANPGTKNVNVKGHWIETDELGAAKKAADSGHKIFFTPETKIDNVSNNDVLINNRIGDIKHIFTPTASAVKEAIRRARRQGSSAVLIEIVTPNISIDTIKPLVKSQLGNRINFAIVLLNGQNYLIRK